MRFEHSDWFVTFLIKKYLSEYKELDITSEEDKQNIDKILTYINEADDEYWERFKAMPKGKEKDQYIHEQYLKNPFYDYFESLNKRK